MLSRLTVPWSIRWGSAATHLLRPGQEVPGEKPSGVLYWFHEKKAGTHPPTSYFSEFPQWQE